MAILPNINFKDYIKRSSTDEQLFAYFLNTTVGTIVHCINEKEQLRNPLRIDRKPSVSFFKVAINEEETEFKIKMYDWANDKYKGDIFDIVAVILKVDIQTGKGFVETCKHIISIIPFLEEDLTIADKSENSICDIDIIRRDFQTFDYKYWDRYKIYRPILEKYVTPIEHLIVDGRVTYTFNRLDPAYGYYLGGYKGVKLWQVYFPKRRKSDVRFITNNVYPLMAIGNMKKGTSLVITKSMKDMMCFESLRYYIVNSKAKNQVTTHICFPMGSSLNIDTVSLSSESIRLSADQMYILQQQYKDIYINSDLDEAGDTCRDYYTKTFGCIPITTEDKQFKDMAEYMKRNTVIKTKELYAKYFRNRN